MVRSGLFVGLLALAGCAGSLPTVRVPARGDGLRYEAALANDAAQLVVEASVPAGVPPYFGVATGAVPFVRDFVVGVENDDGRVEWSKVAPTDTFFLLPACAERGCRIHYRFALNEAARALHDVDRATWLAPNVVEAPPSTWLVRPIGLAHGAYRLHVTTTRGASFASGVYPARDGEPLAFEGDVSDLRLAPYTVMGRFGVEKIADPARNLAIDIALPAAFADRTDDVRAWVERSARVVADYYGTFPARHALVVVAPTDVGDGVSHGRTMGNGGAASIVWMRGDSSAQALRDDWVLPHELVHTALPSVIDERHRWFEEGVATYVEGLARASAGELPEESFWGDLLEGLPKGLPHRGDRGLDHTQTWGRRYWGGALFCFLADMEIRRRTGGRESLADALRGIAHAGGNVSVGWTLERTLATGDAAVGANVLRELHDRMGSRPMPVDLGALWSRLGVSVQDGHVVLDDDAPASALRRSFIRTRAQ